MQVWTFNSLAFEQRLPANLCYDKKSSLSGLCKIITSKAFFSGHKSPCGEITIEVYLLGWKLLFYIAFVTSQWQINKLVEIYRARADINCRWTELAYVVKLSIFKPHKSGEFSFSFTNRPSDILLTVKRLLQLKIKASRLTILVGKLFWHHFQSQVCVRKQSHLSDVWEITCLAA